MESSWYTNFEWAINYGMVSASKLPFVAVVDLLQEIVKT